MRWHSTYGCTYWREAQYNLHECAACQKWNVGPCNISHTRRTIAIKPLTTNDLQRRRAVSHLKIKIPSKKCMKSQQMQHLFIQFINPLAPEFPFKF
jgi:hypothetical protein